MEKKLTCIVVHLARYNDKVMIAHTFSRESGRMAFAVHVGSSARSRQRVALFAPMNVLEIDAKMMAGKSIHNIREVRLLDNNIRLQADPVKNAVTLFMSELLGKIVFDNEENQLLFDYVRAAVAALDILDEGVANFHLLFLYRLTIFLGIQPDVGSFNDGYVFNMREGIFQPQYIGSGREIASVSTSTAIVALDNLTYSTLNSLPLQRIQRNEILDTLLNYIGLHSGITAKLKSPEVLKQLFC